MDASRDASKDAGTDSISAQTIGSFDLASRLVEVEAKCVAHGIVLQAIVGLLPDSTVQELKAAATSVDDEGMQEANPDPQLRRIAAQIRHLLQLL